MARARTWAHKCFKRLCMAPGLRLALVYFWTRMAQALCSVLALTVSVEMFFACAFEKATTIMDAWSGDAEGHTYSTTGKTTFCTTCVFPEPPWPRRSKCVTSRSLQGLLFTSSSQAWSQAAANLATNSVWSRVSLWSSGKAPTRAEMYALGVE